MEDYIITYVNDDEIKISTLIESEKYRDCHFSDDEEKDIRRCFDLFPYKENILSVSNIAKAVLIKKDKKKWENILGIKIEFLDNELFFHRKNNSFVIIMKLIMSIIVAMIVECQ